MNVERVGSGDVPLVLAAIDRLGIAKHRASPEYFESVLSAPSNIVIIASEGTEAVGFLVAYTLARLDEERPMVCLYEIEVAPGRRREGIGKCMIEVLQKHCRALDATKIWGIVDRSNEGAVAFYEKVGAELGRSDGHLSFVFRPEAWDDRTGGVPESES